MDALVIFFMVWLAARGPDFFKWRSYLLISGEEESTNDFYFNSPTKKREGLKKLCNNLREYT